MEGNTAITRRQALRDLGAASLGVGALGGGLDALLAAAASAAPKQGSLADIEHVVILMQENRSFDHYFGTLSGVRGFGDKQGRAAFFQKSSAGQTIHPFHLPKGCLPDISHEWGPQHRSWNGGKMDGWITSRDQPDVDGPAAAVETMGYHDGSDLRFYYALANAFTICDMYFCSVIGPTDPNRLMSMSATIDPAGAQGGPLLQTNLVQRGPGFTWRTMPEQLSAKGVSWKVYGDNKNGAGLDNVLSYFTQYSPGSKLESLGLKPTYPGDFLSDVGHNKLPQVSWVLTSIVDTEHPDFSTPHAGEAAARAVVEAVMSNPKVWQKTALFITWDENGGFFDHVTPPTAPPNTPGEYLTVASLPNGTTRLGNAEGIRGPIGLGFRVPMLVVSPFSRGGLVSSDTFDHTSTLRFLETRFRVQVPNLSKWRRRTTGDLTSAFNFGASPSFGKPSLAKPRVGDTKCLPSISTPVGSTSGPFPTQARGERKRPSGIVKR